MADAEHEAITIGRMRRRRIDAQDVEIQRRENIRAREVAAGMTEAD